MALQPESMIRSHNLEYCWPSHWAGVADAEADFGESIDAEYPVGQASYFGRHDGIRSAPM